jgi:two-component system, OmpR family, response regulator ChvI
MTKELAKIKRRVLAVDDDPDITLTVKEGLESSSSDSVVFEVDAFNDPELALSSFKPGLYDLVLLDFRMPKMNGYELYDKMEKIDNQVKVCFMSATYVNYEAAREAFPLMEIECFIQKPVEIKDLISRINAELRN